uniref:Secreted protein n=1 Tax=Parascaris univalens TaxID=6257 RepID=A0A914ZXZ8_PARUN
MLQSKWGGLAMCLMCSKFSTRPQNKRMLKVLETCIRWYSFAIYAMFHRADRIYQLCQFYCISGCIT